MSIPHRDATQYTENTHRHDERRPPVTDERKRDAGTREPTRHRPDVDGRLDHQLRRDPEGDEHGEVVVRMIGDVDGAERDEKQ